MSACDGAVKSSVNAMKRCLIIKDSSGEGPKVANSRPLHQNPTIHRHQDPIKEKGSYRFDLGEMTCSEGMPKLVSSTH